MRRKKSQEHRHVERKIDDPVLHFQIGGMKYIGNKKLFPEFGDKFLDRREGMVFARFYFDRRDVMAGSRLALCNEKIDLHSRCGVGFRRAGIKVQFMPAGYKHLRDDILHEHPFVSDAAKRRRGRGFNMLLEMFSHA